MNKKRQHQPFTATSVSKRSKCHTLTYLTCGSELSKRSMQNTGSTTPAGPINTVTELVWCDNMKSGRLVKHRSEGSQYDWSLQGLSVSPCPPQAFRSYFAGAWNSEWTRVLTLCWIWLFSMGLCLKVATMVRHKHNVTHELIILLKQVSQIKTLHIQITANHTTKSQNVITYCIR